MKLQDFKKIIREEVRKVLSEVSAKTSDIDTIIYVHPEYNGSVKRKLYKLVVVMKNKKEMTYRSIDDFNKAFNLSLDHSLSLYPEKFVTVMKKLLPGIEVELRKFDVS